MANELYITGTGQKIFVHCQEDCSGYCPIHNPSNHRMVNWPTHWRADRGIMERICPHGIGHPDPDDREVRESPILGLHGCDGCCRDPKTGDNPGGYPLPRTDH